MPFFMRVRHADHSATHALSCAPATDNFLSAALCEINSQQEIANAVHLFTGANSGANKEGWQL